MSRSRHTSRPARQRRSDLRRPDLRRRRPGWFRPVLLRARRGGWTPARQCAFLVALYRHGSVRAACRAVGISRNSAYRLRAHPAGDSFAAAWDRVLTRPGTGRVRGPKTDWRKVTLDALSLRATTGLLRPVMWRGTMTAIARKRDDTALLRLLKRLDNACREPELQGAGAGR